MGDLCHLYSKFNQAKGGQQRLERYFPFCPYIPHIPTSSKAIDEEDGRPRKGAAIFIIMIYKTNNGLCRH
ncbi:hypothetical protein PALA111701_23510 [Paenibacillus lactis]